MLRTAVSALFLCASGALAENRSISLAGEWRFRLDPDDMGINAGWFKTELPQRIQLPGSTDEHRFGTKHSAREPRRLTRAYEYVGPAWYQRDVLIPDAWLDKRITLLLERCHWETQAWLDERWVGLQNSLSTPHLFDLGGAVAPGRHRLTIRVDNRLKIDVGPWASGVTEEGPSNWNGIVGRLELQARDALWIHSVFVYPDGAQKTARLILKVRNSTGQAQQGQLRASVILRSQPLRAAEVTKSVAISDRPETVFEVEVPLAENPAQWDEFSPSVHDMAASLVSAAGPGGFSDEIRASFGIRRLEVAGKELYLNGRGILLRGTVDNGAFPLRGYPPTDVETWRSRFRTYQEHGINHVRFHSWCPPEAAFSAADDLALILQVENPLWIGDGRVSANALRTAFIRQEAEAIVDTYGNHPSFCLMSMGNELGNGLDVFLGELVKSLRARDSRHLYTSTTAPDNIRRPDDYFVSAGPRWQNLRGDPRLEKNPPNTDFDYRDYIAAIDRPVIAHELGQWTVFPNLAEAGKYTGVLQPRYFEIYRESLERNGLLHQAGQFHRASGAFMTALYKEEIESVLRTPGLAGFQLLGLSDWPGFGPAFIGVLDALNTPKGLIEPDAFRRFNAPTVILLRMKKRLWTTAETLSAQLEVAHYGPNPIDGTPSWRVRDGQGRAVASGTLPPVTIATGWLAPLGALRLPLEKLAAPARYTIDVSLNNLANNWDIWIYPASLAAVGADVVLARTWDSPAREALRDGKKVVLFAAPEMGASTVPTSFTTAFWSLLWFPKRRETMGILCDPAHPALAGFPTTFHSDWQWWDLTSGSRAFVLDDAPAAHRPIVQVIDDANRNHRLGAVFEARAGSGRLLAVSFDLESKLETRLAARQLRHSLLEYAASARFEPQTAMDIELLDRLFSPDSR